VESFYLSRTILLLLVVPTSSVVVFDIFVVVVVIVYQTKPTQKALHSSTSFILYVFHPSIQQPAANSSSNNAIATQKLQKLLYFQIKPAEARLSWGCWGEGAVW